MISQLSAPVTIKGVTFDAGDALRLGILGYKAGKKGVEKFKANAPRREEKKSIKKFEKKKKIKNPKQSPTMAQNVTRTTKYDNIV